MQKKFKLIALDLDGVIANFSKASCRKLGIEYPKNHTFVYGEMEERVGGKARFYSSIRGHDYWANIELYPWGKELIKLAKEFGEDWIILTKPTLDVGCYSGKYEFVRKNLHCVDRLWIANGSKARVCHGPEYLLIDDKPKNGEDWVAKGGTFFNWPEVSEDVDVTQRLGDLKALLSKGYDTN